MHHVLAIELLTASQAIDLRPDGPARLGQGTARAYAEIRHRVPFLAHDRQTTSDIEALTDLIRSGALLDQDEARSSTGTAAASCAAARAATVDCNDRMMTPRSEIQRRAANPENQKLKRGSSLSFARIGVRLHYIDGAPFGCESSHCKATLDVRRDLEYNRLEFSS